MRDKDKFLVHNKASRVTKGVGAPKRNDGYDGDMTIRLLQDGLFLYLKYNKRWYLLSELVSVEKSNKRLSVSSGNSNTLVTPSAVASGNIGVRPLGKLHFNYSPRSSNNINLGNTFVQLQRAGDKRADNITKDALKFVIKDKSMMNLIEDGSASQILIPTGSFINANKIFFDNSPSDTLGDTHISSPSADELTITVGNQSMMHFVESTTNTIESEEIAEYLIRSGTTEDPVLHLKNTTNDATGPTLKLSNEKAGVGNVGADDDVLGTVSFDGEDDGGNTQQYGLIKGSIDVATDGQESGKIIIQVASHDGDLNDGITFTGGDENGEVDIVLGSGNNSIANVTGSLQVQGGTLKFKERSSALADIGSLGQVWVKNETPNELYFTNDDGNDIQITYNDHLAPTEAIRLQVRNDEGSTIAAGAPLYSKGEIGGSERILVGVCDADDASKMPCIGIAYEEMNTTSTKDNYAIVTGVYNTNISGFTGLSDGDNLYVQTDGSLSQDKPTATDALIQNVGIVLRTNGSICQGLFVSAIGRTNDVPNTNERPLYIKERASADTDAASYGQLWVDDASPNELAFTDDAGTDIVGIGKYHYETKICNFYASVLSVTYLPIVGYVIERTSSAGQNEYISMIAPFDGTLEKFAWRSEAQQGTGSGTMRFVVAESQDGTEVPGLAVYRKDLTGLNIADDTYTEYDLTSPSIGSYPIPITKGRIYNFAWTPAAIPYDTNVTLVFKWDITS